MTNSDTLTREILVVRHGSTEWSSMGILQGQMDTCLTKTGRRQAEHVASYLGHAEVCAIYSSDLIRAFETATIIGDRIGIVPVKDSRLREIDAGEWSGCSKADLAANHPHEWKVWRNGGRPPHKGETYKHLSQRVMAAFTDILSCNHQGAIVVVTHSGVIRTFLSTVLNKPLYGLEKAVHVSEGSVTVIQHDLHEGWIITEIGRTNLGSP